MLHTLTDIKKCGGHFILGGFSRPIFTFQLLRGEILYEGRLYYAVFLSTRSKKYLIKAGKTHKESVQFLLSLDNKLELIAQEGHDLQDKNNGASLYGFPRTLNIIATCLSIILIAVSLYATFISQHMIGLAGIAIGLTVYFACRFARSI